MTRLTEDNVTHIVTGMEEYNRILKQKTGRDLRTLAREACEIPEDRFDAALKDCRAGVIRITQGEGIIGDFAESVAAILCAIGVKAECAEDTDVAGIYECVSKHCDILFFADDDRYLAVNIARGIMGENDRATALGYIHVLRVLMERQGKDIRKERILVIGYGRVGKEAGKILKDTGVSYDLYDHDPAALSGAAGAEVILTDPSAIKNYQYILDYTNEGEWLTEDLLAENALYVTPGLPYSPDRHLAEKIEDTAVHDELEIGTAVMLGMVIQ